MTLADKDVAQALREKFVCGWKNIKDEEHAGRSNDHAPSSKAADVNNGSGFHNVQIFVLTPDGRVLHCLPGYWKPDVLLQELDFALTLIGLWQDEKLSLKEKAEKFTDAHLEHVRRHGDTVVRQSELPEFDRRSERVKGTDSSRADGEVKKADQIVHERMAERPFVEFSKFDTAVFTDIGQKFYDAHTDGCSHR